ncbi:hypothetical protein WT37_10040 [Burkholderia territorii]|nr:hypothetical protein WT37_10040 [Burkholderia territorii]
MTRASSAVDPSHDACLRERGRVTLRVGSSRNRKGASNARPATQWPCRAIDPTRPVRVRLFRIAKQRARG